MTRPGASKEPIAIVGIGCRFPGRADSPAAFWQMLCEGRDAICEVPSDRWLVDAFYDPEQGKPGRTPSRYGGFVEHIDLFDSQFFGISAREAVAIDPQQRLLLEVAWWALEDAGWPADRLAGSATGVFVGISTHDYADLQCAPTERKGSPNPYMCTGSALSIAANRISYVLDFRGPSFAVDTACSSSLVALHLGCRSIWQGEADQALVGGVNALLKPEMTLGFSQANMLSPNGRCRSFDAGADGYVRAEGAGCVVIKPLSVALRDGDRVYAVVRGSAINQDGRTPGISVPSASAQEAMLVEACRDAGVHPHDIQYVEAHGTGTPVGDPIEAAAIAAVLGRGRPQDGECLLGSVKSNIGHLESGAGIAGLIKTALALYHQQVPPNLHFDTPNPKIDFTGLRVPQRLEPWPKNDAAHQLAGVNSFGFGGSNAHVVLAAPPAGSVPRSSRTGAQRACLLPVSARSEGALAALAGSFADLLSDRFAPALEDICHSAGVRRTHHPHRLAVIADSAASAADALGAYVRHEPSARTATGRAAARTPLVFVFTGMGPQWLGMGRQLLSDEPVFRGAIEECDTLFRVHSAISPLQELMAEEKDSQLQEDRVAQIALFSIQVGLVGLWRSWGIEPDAIVGHSAGEMAAAWAAGALTLEDAVRVTFHRSRVQHRLEGKGRMLTIGLPLEDVEELLGVSDRQVWLAAVNGPRSVTLSGDATLLAEIEQTLGRTGTFCRFVYGNTPYHSGLLDESREDVLSALSDVRPRSSQRPLWSTVFGSLAGGAELDADYWWLNMRQPVRFAPVVDALLEGRHTTFLEIGPHPVLAGSIKECAAKADCEAVVFASLRRRAPERETLLASLGQLYARGHSVAWDALFTAGRRVTLPLYPWQRQRCWRESEGSRLLRLGLTEWNECGQLTATVHPLLGRRLPMAHPEVVWQVELDLPRTHAWICDHVIQGTILFPAVGYLEMALEASAEGRVAEDLEIHKPLALARDNPQPLQLLIDRAQRIFTVHAQQADGTWTRQASGRLGSSRSTSAAARLDLTALRARLPFQLSGPQLYERYQEFGLQFGPLFQGIEQIWMGPDESLARVCVLPQLVARLSEYNFHPAVLDACLQVFLAATFHRVSGLYLPVAVSRVQLHRVLREIEGASGRPLWSHARVTSRSSRQITFDLTICDDDGNSLIGIENLVCKAAGAAGEPKLELAEYAWKLQPRPATEPAYTQGWQLPSLDLLLEVLRPEVESLARLRDRRRHYRDFVDAQQRLSVAYVVDGFRRLGWQFAYGDRRTVEDLAARLRIAPPFRAVLEQMLVALSDANILRRREDVWEVVRVPETTDPADLWRVCLTRLPAYLAEWTLMSAYGSGLHAIVRGEIDAGELMADSAPWQQLFDSSPSLRIYNEIVQRMMLSLLDHVPRERPLRVLGLHGSSGLATRLLPVLPAQRMRYVSVDRARGSSQPDERLGAYPNVEYRTLDLEKDPSEQGLALHTFDVIVGVHALQTLADVPLALRHVQQLLAPGGLAVLVEPNRPFLMSLGALLPDCPATGHEPSRDEVAEARRWSALLENAGFAHSRLVTDVPWEQGPPSHSVVVAQAAVPILPPISRTSSDPTAVGDWLVVAQPSSDHTAVRLVATLAKLGGRAVVSRPGSKEVAADGGGAELRGIVYVAPRHDAPNAPSHKSLTTMTETCMEVIELARFVSSARRPRLWIVTSGVQPLGDNRGLNVVHAPLWGLARVIANEVLPLRCSRIDLGLTPDSDEIEALVRELTTECEDDELALRGRDRYVHVLEPRPPATVMPGAFAVQNDSPGSLSGLVVRRIARRPPDRGHVEIEVHATGLNFKDVAMAMKLLGDVGLSSGAPLGLDPGLECAGRVAAVGPGVDGIRVGDDVLAFALNSFASHVVTDARFVMRRPAQLSAEEAASVPIVFLTVYHALYDLAQLQAGERLLVHSATGGVGLAAVQLAQRVGAEIYATAGSPQKRAFLQALGVRHVFSSRSLEFASEVWERSGGTGIDVVLNSLGGDFIARGLDLLRDGGRFVELGKRDVEQNTHLGLKAFDRQLAFFTIDLNRMAFTRPALLERLQREVVALFEGGELHVLPHRVFPVTRVREAFRTMLKAKHVGKLVVSMREPGVAMMSARDERMPVRRDATYLITGGLGGFGLATAQWLVEQGAQHLVLMGRQGVSRSDALCAVETLKATGTDVHVKQVNVADATAMAAVLTDIRQTMPPLRGIVHAAMVIDDCTIAELTNARLEDVLAPKAHGAWNLHLLTRDDPVDWFVLYSSVVSMIGNPGQANYAAANAFLDLLAHHRRRLGLPALTVNWGAVSDVGYLTRHGEVAQHLARIGVRGLPVRRLLACLPGLIRDGATQVSVHSLEWRRLNTFVPSIARVSRLAAVRGIVEGDDDRTMAQNDGSFRERLLAMSPSERRVWMQTLIQTEFARLLGTAPDQIDIDRPVTELGVDSLMAVELGLVLGKTLQTEVPTMALLSGGTLAQFASTLCAASEGTVALKESDAATPPSATERLRREQVDTEQRRDGDRSIQLQTVPRLARPRGPALAGDSIDYLAEAQLDPAIQPPASTSFDPTKRDGVLLTGATGFLGAFVLDDLLRMTSAKVHCVVRATSVDEARQRIVDNLRRYELTPPGVAERVAPLVADLTKQRLGVSEKEFDRLADEMDAIYHVGAVVNLVYPYPLLRAANVAGTEEILRLASRGRLKPTHHVSTFWVHAANEQTRAVVNEDDPLPPCEALPLGYSQSKWVAERMILQARQRGLPVSIYRAGYITGDSRTGICNTDDFLHLLTSACTQIGAIPAVNMHLEITPVDFVSRAIVHLSLQAGHLGNSYHLVNPRPIPLSTLAAWMEQAGLNVRSVSYAAWREKLADLARGGSNALIAPVLNLLGDGVSAGWHPRYDCRLATSHLAPGGIVCPPADDRLLSTYHDFLHRAGVLREHPARFDNPRRSMAARHSETSSSES